MCVTNEKVFKHLQEKTSTLLIMWRWRSGGSQFQRMRKTVMWLEERLFTVKS